MHWIRHEEQHQNVFIKSSKKAQGREGREDVGEQFTSDFSLVSDWSRVWYKVLRQIAEHSLAKVNR